MRASPVSIDRLSTLIDAPLYFRSLAGGLSQFLLHVTLTVGVLFAAVFPQLARGVALFWFPSGGRWASPLNTRPAMRFESPTSVSGPVWVAAVECLLDHDAVRTWCAHREFSSEMRMPLHVEMQLHAETFRATKTKLARGRASAGHAFGDARSR